MQSRAPRGAHRRQSGRRPSIDHSAPPVANRRSRSAVGPTTRTSRSSQAVSRSASSEPRTISAVLRASRMTVMRPVPGGASGRESLMRRPSSARPLDGRRPALRSNRPRPAARAARRLLVVTAFTTRRALRSGARTRRKTTSVSRTTRRLRSRVSARLVSTSSRSRSLARWSARSRSRSVERCLGGFAASAAASCASSSAIRPARTRGSSSAAFRPPLNGCSP
jgi:hypothetical protein